MMVLCDSAFQVRTGRETAGIGDPSLSSDACYPRPLVAAKNIRVNQPTKVAVAVDEVSNGERDHHEWQETRLT